METPSDNYINQLNINIPILPMRHGNPDNDPLYQAINMFKNITDRPPMAFLMQIGYINDVLDALAKDLLNAEFNDLDDDLIELLKNALDYLDRVNDLIKRWHEAKITVGQ